MSNRKYETELLKMILNEDYEPGTSSPSKEARNAFLESVANFNNMGEAIYREDSLEECVSRLRSIVEQASQVTMDESEHWFDKVTVSRHVKQLNEAMKVFEKTATEMNQLQQRLESSYDDIGMILNRYYNINEALKDSEYIKEGKKYKLGDSYSRDFDIDGMFDMAATVTDKWSLSDLKKLYHSMEDMNFHEDAAPLWDAIGAIEDGQKGLASRYLKDFVKKLDEHLMRESYLPMKLDRRANI